MGYGYVEMPLKSGAQPQSPILEGERLSVRGVNVIEALLLLNKSGMANVKNNN